MRRLHSRSFNWQCAFRFLKPTEALRQRRIFYRGTQNSLWTHVFSHGQELFHLETKSDSGHQVEHVRTREDERKKGSSRSGFLGPHTSNIAASS